jgi:hypothetical protein
MTGQLEHFRREDRACKPLGKRSRGEREPAYRSQQSNKKKRSRTVPIFEHHNESEGQKHRRKDQRDAQPYYVFTPAHSLARFGKFATDVPGRESPNRSTDILGRAGGKEIADTDRNQGACEQEQWPWHPP